MAVVFHVLMYNHLDPVSNVSLVGGINNFSFILPPSPILTQKKDIGEYRFCDEVIWPKKCDNVRLCHCVHRIYAKLNSLVEVILVDDSNGKLTVTDVLQRISDLQLQTAGIFYSWPLAVRGQLLQYCTIVAFIVWIV